jgi:mono/diheme cytochrome c family protein
MVPVLKKVSIVGFCVLAAAGCSPSGGSPAALGGNLTEQIAEGKTLYETACAQCHYDGAGSAVAPDLQGSAVLQESPRVLAGIILRGRQGESLKDGGKFGGFMPPQAYLRDEEIAAIVAYVRSAYGGVTEAVSPAEVAEVRVQSVR